MACFRVYNNVEVPSYVTLRCVTYVCWYPKTLWHVRYFQCGLPWWPDCCV